MKKQEGAQKNNTEDAYRTVGSKKARINNKVGSVVSDNTGLTKVVKVANPRRKTREAVQN